MKPFAKPFLAAKFFAGLALVIGFVSQPAYAGIPVIDATNVVQTTTTALEAVQAVEKQVQQYETQLNQYENELKNTVAPAAYIWSQVQDVTNKILAAQQTITYYTNQSGSISTFLNRYENTSYYRSSPCFSATGCSQSSLQALSTSRETNNAARVMANQELAKSVAQQQATLTTDASNLESLNSQATDADGQMKALQATNQLASMQAHQLLQIRGLLAAQSQAAAMAANADSDRQAQYAASAEHLRDTSNYSTTLSPTTWSASSYAPN